MEPDGRAFFGVGANCAVFRFEGSIRHTMAQGLELFVDEALAAGGFETAVIDLRQTTLIDSTGIGLLARIGNHTLSRLGRRTVLICEVGDVDRSLRAVDFDQVFELVVSPPVELPPLEAIPIADLARRSRRTHGRVVLDSHHDLMAISQRNRRAFEAIVGALEREVIEEETER